MRGLADLSPLADVASLKFLFLQALKQITSLPSFATLPQLRRVHLQVMKGLTDLAPIAAAPALKELTVIEMPHLEPEAFRVFVGHPTLERAWAGLGSERNAEAVWAMLPNVLPERAPGVARESASLPRPCQRSVRRLDDCQPRRSRDGATPPIDLYFVIRSSYRCREAAWTSSPSRPSTRS